MATDTVSFSDASEKRLCRQRFSEASLNGIFTHAGLSRLHYRIFDPANRWIGRPLLDGPDVVR